MAKSSTRAKRKYNEKTYKRYQLSLRKVDDAEYIEMIDKARENGWELKSLIKYALDELKKEWEQ